MRWRGPLFALAGAAAVVGIMVGVRVGGDGDGGSSVPLAASERGAAPAAPTARRGTTQVAGEVETQPPIRVGTVVRNPKRFRFGHRLLVGTVDDSLKQSDPALAGQYARISRDAGFDAVLLSSVWRRGLDAPTATERTALETAAAAATKHDLRLFIFVWHGLSGGTPHTRAARQQFARYAAAIVRELPSLDAIVVGNEPNLNTFWMPQFGRDGSNVAARGYLDLLARTYDAIKAVAPRLTVIGGALAPRGSDRPELKRHTHSPTQFIKDLGTAYRDSGRTKPVMDAFAIHPYMRTSAFPPTDTHEQSTTITIADYPKLTALLAEAFKGTSQRGRGLPVYYTEFGVQTTVPAQHSHAYTQLGSPSGRDAVTAATQAKYYRLALLIAACQPTVRGLFVFHTFDERDLRGWQSGLYYADQKPKPSLRAFRAAAALARTARLTRCAAGTFVRTG